MQDALCSGFPLTLLTNIVNERITDGRTEQRTDGLKDGWGDGKEGRYTIFDEVPVRSKFR